MKRIDATFLKWFRSQTESKWKTWKIDQGTYGYQIQADTRWNPGLCENDIEQFERELGFRFPDDFRLFLSSMNGTDLPTLNVYGDSDYPHAVGTGVYSYPRDLKLMKERLKMVAGELDEIVAELKSQGFDLRPEARLIPFYSHRFLLSDPKMPEIPVFSIRGTDAIIYASNFRDYLESEFLTERKS